jgi:hypothetical protein
MKKYLLSFIGLIVIILGLSTEISAQATFGTGPLYVRVGPYGEIRIFTIEGVDTVQHINRISLIAAGNTDQVIDYWNDLEVVLPTELVASPQLSDYEITGTYDNSYSELPPDFLIEQHAYGWNGQSYGLVKCIVTNQETTEMPVLAGLDVVQYVDYTWEDDHIYYDITNQLLTQYDIHYVAIKILSEPTTSGQVFNWYTGYQNSDPDYYSWLYAGTFDTDTLITDADGGVGILGGTPTTFQPNATITVYFAVSVGADETEMLANMQLAQEKYYLLTSMEADHNSIPNGYVLEQNYPNPFNPSTTIKFGLPESSNVSLKIFNSLGEEVAVLVNENLGAGTYTYRFNASGLPSGIYIYTLQSGDQIISKKMTFLK